METFICTRCGKMKEKSEYYCHKKSGRSSYCKACHLEGCSKHWEGNKEHCRERNRKYISTHREDANKRQSKYLSKNPWMRGYDRARSRCVYKRSRYNQRGIKFLMTKEDFRMLWYRDKAELMKQPSIDRKDTRGDYTVENCRYIEFLANCMRRRAS